MPNDSFENSFRVLSLDGGGVRGLYTVSLLHSLAAHFAAITGSKHKTKDAAVIDRRSKR